MPRPLVSPANASSLAIMLIHLLQYFESLTWNRNADKVLFSYFSNFFDLHIYSRSVNLKILQTLSVISQSTRNFVRSPFFNDDRFI